MGKWPDTGRGLADLRNESEVAICNALIAGKNSKKVIARASDFNPRKVAENVLLELVSKPVSGVSLKAILSLGSRIEAFGN